MFKKITEKEVVNLKKGHIVVKYPVTGEPRTEVDQTDFKQMLVMKVDKIVFPYVNLLFQMPRGSSLAALARVNINPLHKTKKQLVNEDKWWLYVEKNDTF